MAKDDYPAPERSSAITIESAPAPNPRAVRAPIRSHRSCRVDRPAGIGRAELLVMPSLAQIRGEVPDSGSRQKHRRYFEDTWPVCSSLPPCSTFHRQ